MAPFCESHHKMLEDRTGGVLVRLAQVAQREHVWKSNFGRPAVDAMLSP